MATLVADGCFSPDLGQDPFSCGPGGVCPAGYQCITGICRDSSGTAGPLPGIDMSLVGLDTASSDRAGGADKGGADSAHAPDVSPGVDVAGGRDLATQPDFEPGNDVVIPPLPDLVVGVDMQAGSDGDVVINEVNFAADSSSSSEAGKREYVELYNRGSGDVDISGWSIGDNTLLTTHIPLAVLPPGTVLPAKQFLVVFDSGVDLQALDAPGARCYNLFQATSDWSPTGALNNSGDLVSLYKSMSSFTANTLIDFMTYSASGTIASANSSYDDQAVQAGIWAAGKAVVGASSSKTPVALTVDGQSPHRTTDPAADWSQYPGAGTPCLPN